MHVDTTGQGPNLIWVMGWGNNADSRHERWFIDRLLAAGYRVHAVELPTNGTDFEAQYLAPLRRYRDEVGDHRLIAHSMGGLAVAHLQPEDPVIYLSPWWGLAEEPGVLERVLFALPTAQRILPAPVNPELLGGLAAERDVTAPDRLSPAWLRTMRAAQADLPSIHDEDVVFYTPEDRVVDPTAIEAHAKASQLERYDGGHELFASTDREAHIERVLAALNETDPHG